MVGDEQPWLEAIGRYLLALEFPVEVISFDDAGKACQFLAGKRADLVICDTSEAEQESIKLCEKIRGVDAGVPIIATGDVSALPGVAEFGNVTYVSRASLFLDLARAAGRVLQRSTQHRVVGRTR